MSLVVKISITGGGSLRTIDTLVISRLESLRSRADPTEEIHNYHVHRDSDGATGTFQHRYGDGAQRCVELALGQLEPQPTPVADTSLHSAGK